MSTANQHPAIILASQSPRRRYLLKQAGLQFSVIPSGIDESTVESGPPEHYVRTLAETKAADIADRFPDSWVIGADTVVLINGAVLGKPVSLSDARRMLMQLSGQTHQVLTGFAVICKTRQHFHSQVVSTDVHFKSLSEKEIEWYIHTREPFDKAGAYAIQGLGTFLVKGIRGSYTNVVGLPVCEVIEHLILHGVIRLEDHLNHPDETGEHS
ncbi:MAG: Maf family protein [Thermodesulfobacteriota bacterium]